MWEIYGVVKPDFEISVHTERNQASLMQAGFFFLTWEWEKKKKQLVFELCGESLLRKWHNFLKTLISKIVCGHIIGNVFLFMLAKREWECHRNLYICYWFA